MPYARTTYDNTPLNVTATKMNNAEAGIDDLARSATVVVAASNATARERAAADYECAGSGDQATINSALADIGAGGLLQLTSGDFAIAGTGVAVEDHSVTIQGIGRGHRSNATHGAVAVGSRLVAASGLTGQMLKVAAASGSAPLFGVDLRHFTLDGNAIGTAVDGLLYRSYMGTVLNLQLARNTGHGIHPKGYRIAAGDAADWDLYDSKLIGCNVDTTTLDSLFFDYGATDMHLVHCVLLATLRDNIHMVNAAGSLQCTGVHTYDAGRYNIHLEGTGSRSKFSNMKIEGAGQHGFFIDSTPGAGPSDVQIVGCNFHDNGDLTTNTYDHISCAGTNAINRLNIVGCNLGWKNSGQANKPRYAINAATSGAQDWKVSGCSFGPSSNWGTGPINKASSASLIVDMEYTATPESVIPASIGSRVWNTAGGAGTTLYVKQSGTLATGWVGK